MATLFTWVTALGASAVFDQRGEQKLFDSMLALPGRRDSGKLLVSLAPAIEMSEGKDIPRVPLPWGFWPVEFMGYR